MSKKYRHIKQYEKEILELRNQGLTQREIAERLGFSKDQVKEFFHRYNRNQKKLATGIAIKRKGRPPKDCVVTEQDNGTYEFRWTTRDGKRHSVYAPTIVQLREQERLIIVDEHDGIKSDVKSITVNEMYKLWCQLKRGIKDSTMKNYMYMYEMFVIRDCNDEILEKVGIESDPVLLPDFSCHNLRHTFATRLCESGINLKVIQDVLGHADVKTTMNIYVDVTTELKKKEIALFGDFMEGIS